ncbi:hypothetical protein [Fodinibius halophilus]|uniref:Uncharacterized protein n=1 Tax=Fodinibius halophilus TaxID=1736908 RepID=A0A6M1T196_9BACT|nr:hypothetical protein [Fodinibius halophilus]NGP87739.1 hypothetical protein [Fodinibius halophilus]
MDLSSIINKFAAFLLTLTVIVFTVNSKGYAQYSFGDLEVTSLKKVFDVSNSDLWGDKTPRNIYPFQGDSDIWDDHPLAGLIIKKDLRRANFLTKQKNSKKLMNKLTTQLVEQFESGDTVQVDDPLVIPPKDIEMKRWIHREEENRYKILLGISGENILLVITQKNEQ